MRYKDEITGLGSRPYPLDRERRRRVLIAMAEKELTISKLSRTIGIAQSIVSQVISGRRLSLKTEKLIAKFLGKSADYLFPYRQPEEIKAMRIAEQRAKCSEVPRVKQKGKAA